jgi:hypothetical protein
MIAYNFTTLRSGPDEPAKLVEEGIVVREVLPIGPGLCRILQMNFYEKALFVKPTWRPLCGGRNCSLPFALSFYSHSLGELTLVSSSVHHGIRLDSS